jgi:S-(hydroxymethyl)glutathione dehydrogenase/alcohol dehydrogenase
MKTRSAVLYAVGQPLKIEELELDEPKEREALVRMVATGFCHSDYHFMAGDAPIPFPMALGHEGAGIVEKVGPGVTRVKPGDHVVFTFIPNCGRCYFCISGMSQLCDLGALILQGPQLDGTYRLRKGNQNIGQIFMTSPFSEWTVAPEASLVRIDAEYPLERACLVSCGVATGVGAAVNRAKVAPGSSVLVIGCGGVGSNVVQGARAAGAGMIIAADLVDFKLEMARKFGATHTINNGRESLIEKVMGLTNGRGVDYAFEVIATPVTIGQAFDATRKGGTTVVVGMTSAKQETIPVNPFVLVLWQKSLLGTLYGASNPGTDIPRYLQMYRQGLLKLDELVTREYKLDQINQACKDMLDGKNIRGVIRF